MTLARRHKERNEADTLKLGILEMARITFVVVEVFFIFLLAGCLGPVVEVTHVIPGAIPIPAGTTEIVVGDFMYEGYPMPLEDGFLRGLLRDKISEVFPDYPADGYEAMGERILKVGGTIAIVVEDQRNNRLLRQWSPELEQQRNVDSLVRKVSVAASFTLSEADSPTEFVAAETRHEYDSVGDLRVRGPLALERPDDPKRVPDEKTVIKELLAECVNDLGRMMRPITIHAEHRLKYLHSPYGSKGMKAAQAGDLTAAADHFEQALQADPTDKNTVFNLAVVYEAIGDYENAYQHYRQLQEEDDPASQQDVKRVRQVLLNQEG